MLLLLFIVVGFSRRKPKTRKQVVVTCMQHDPKGNTADVVVINLLDLYTRGVGGSPRVMVQHTRVVVGATSYNTAHKLFY